MPAWAYLWGNFPTGKTMVEVDMGNERDYGYDLEADHPAECTECRGAMGLGELRKERGSDYGPVFINHSSIGAIWGGVLAQAVAAGRWTAGAVVPPEIVCLMMVGVKLSREAHRHKTDNIDDAQNYLDFVDELSGGRA